MTYSKNNLTHDGIKLKIYKVKPKVVRQRFTRKHKEIEKILTDTSEEQDFYYETIRVSK